MKECGQNSLEQLIKLLKTIIKLNNCSESPTASAGFNSFNTTFNIFPGYMRCIFDGQQNIISIKNCV